MANIEQTGANPEAEDVQRATTEPDRELTLEVDGLTKIYPDGTLAVDEIDFGIEAGDFCVLIGPSGCGKSTTLHSIIGNIPVTEGQVLLEGEDITETPTYDRDIGLVFQDFQLFPHMTVRENITYGLERIDCPPDEIERRVDDAIDLMHLEGLEERTPEELSAGQQQRVALTRSIVLEPQLLLLDEPLGDMDYKLQKRMERELLRIHRELDTTFVYVTHDQTQAMRLADQIVVMNDGKVEQSDSVENVYNSPATAFVSTFVGDSNVFRGELADVSENGEHALIETPLGSFHTSTENLRSPPSSLVGERIPFSVRPQHIALGPELENELECRVDDVIHQPGSGTKVILTATAEDGTETELQLKSFDRIDPAGTVTVSWSADHGTLLEETSVVDGIDLETDVLGE
ncbi:ABC transporter ATP-binding protein [Natrinema versiforme]|uniref:Molybdate/tungstate import ATP-binding protein WtpC n=1 Tax=Natrinema versiforme JCM 10478 TaxID=1227496 RepID=L9XUV5_9EURY|nr:ABC transporter ATP-binding protein [Natrinema versiforme]ELY65515.1 spermidine/putrescine ABC transporter substrate-binding protein [Natrinema versiforme JCM 10478]